MLTDNSPVEGAAEIRAIAREYARAKEKYETLMCAVVARYGKDVLAKSLDADCDEFLAECSRIEKAIAEKQAAVADAQVKG